MGNLVPSSALPVLNRTLDAIRMRADADGEVFGGEIMDSMREVGSALGVDRLDLCFCERWSLWVRIIQPRSSKITKLECKHRMRSNTCAKR